MLKITLQLFIFFLEQHNTGELLVISLRIGKVYMREREIEANAPSQTHPNLNMM